MRRRLVVLAVAISLMVALSFVIPLAFLVRDLAQDRALAAGERQAQDIARVIATLTPERGVVEASRAIVPIGDANLSTSLILPDGSVVGDQLLPGESPALAITGTAFRTAVGGDQIIYTPVIQENGETVVVRVVVAEEALREGVRQSWEVLAGVVVTLVALGVLAAVFLGRSIVGPVQDLAQSAAQLGEGDLSVRIKPTGPHEIQEAAEEFNRLAERISRLVQRERDAAADLSHRLRTPITALRLDMDGLADSEANDPRMGRPRHPRENRRLPHTALLTTGEPRRRQRSGGCLIGASEFLVSPCLRAGTSHICRYRRDEGPGTSCRTRCRGHD